MQKVTTPKKGSSAMRSKEMLRKSIGVLRLWMALGIALCTSSSFSQSLTWLGTLGGPLSSAYGVSADGSVVVGWAANAQGQQRAFRWQNGVMQDLGTLGGPQSWAFGVSADGSVVVGGAFNAQGLYHAFRWQNGVMQDLGTIGGRQSRAHGVSADGSVVVGGAHDAQSSRAFRWQNGVMEDLNVTYAALLPPGSSLERAYAISPDGRYIVGAGFNAVSWRSEGFLLDTVPEPASATALGAGVLSLLALRGRRKR